MCFIESQTAATPETEPICASADRRRPLREDLVERVLRLAESLPPADRELLVSIYQDGRTGVELAHLLAVDPRTIRRRINRLTERVLSPHYRFVLARRDSWPASRRHLATEVYINGLSLPAAAKRVGISLHTARRHREAILAHMEASRTRAVQEKP